MKPIIHAQCLRHVYPDATEIALCGLDFVVEPAERIAILGPSGCGKSTLLRHILGLLIPSEGKVRVFDVDPAKEFFKIRERIGFVMQDVDEQLTQPTVYDEIAFAPRNFGHAEPEVRTLVESIMKRTGITNLQEKAPHFLSGGQKRKVALASALVLEPELIILDEPFQGLDPHSRDEYIALFSELTRDRKIATVMTLHEVDLVPLLADAVYLLKEGGHISKRGTPREIFTRFTQLKEYQLEPPILCTIFRELKKVFPNIEIPLTPEDALIELKKIK